ncbi:acyltransferase family protein [Spirosoma aerolatum]|uniref:acyltransferase family protein n=1 Tax=Spirosoma aerolatum TaxID=1211326 RepID=UPI0009AE9336|nr:acyltransferase [Spirosoma aerolatum]
MVINQLTFTRFVAAISIVFFHFAISNPIWPLYLPSFRYLVEFIQVGNLSVLYFFVLSGFILTISATSSEEKINKREFYRKRFARIYPIYFISFILSVIFSTNYSAWDYFLNTTLLNGWVWNSNNLNPAAWSLSAEVFFYIVFPFIVPIICTLTNRALITALFVNSIALYFLQVNYNGFYLPKYLPTPIETVLNFSLGIIGGNIFIRFQSLFSRHARIMAVLFVTSIILFCVSILYYHYTWFDGFWLLSIVFLLFIISLSALPKNWFLPRLLSKPMLVKLGDISFSIFILQFPIMHMYDAFLARGRFIIGNTVHFYTYLLILIITSFMTYTFIENPLRRKINNYRKKKKKYTLEAA